MFYIYLLKGGKSKIYIGYTQRLKERLAEHKSGKVYTSSRMENPEVFYYEAYSSDQAAKERERKLKK